MKQKTGYRKIKVKICKEFYIPEEVYTEQYKKVDEIKQAISNNINGWQWSGAYVDYQVQDDVVAMTPGGANILYLDK